MLIIAITTDDLAKPSVPHPEQEELWLGFKNINLIIYHLGYRAMNVHFVALNAMAVIWGQWLLADVAVRADYNQAAKNACGEILGGFAGWDCYSH